MADAGGSSRIRGAIAIAAAALLLAGCQAFHVSPPEPTPQDFGGIAGDIALEGLAVGRPVSGDAGCKDPTMIAAAVGFDVWGKGVTTPLRARVYIFRDREAFERRLADVDTCVAAWARDPSTVEFIQASPYVLVVQGPVPADFKAALSAGLTAAAGNGD